MIIKNSIKGYLIKLKPQSKRTVSAGEIIINKSSCDGCGVCVDTCPNNVISLKDLSEFEIAGLSFKGRIKVKIKGKRKAYVNNLKSCTSCRLCENSCHEFAI
jgi:NAD-dependent dihydropyrimidine dehydrogenase PreA subunit